MNDITKNVEKMLKNNSCEYIPCIYCYFSDNVNEVCDKPDDKEEANDILTNYILSEKMKLL